MVEDKLKKWKMVGKRAYKWNNHYIKPGQIFTAIENNIPIELKSNIILLDKPSPLPVAELDDVTDTKHYRIKSRRGGDYYDIVDTNGKIVNEQKLTQEDAMEMLQKLQ